MISAYMDTYGGPVHKRDMFRIVTKKVANRQRNRSLIDYSGRRFGRLIVLSFVERDPTKENDHKWLFRCDCGTVVTLRIKSVRGGRTSSCGCLARDVLIVRNTTHGLSQLHRKEYRSWKDMRARCNNANDTDFDDYGGRGIKVCERWNDFAAFFADMGERPLGSTLDRIDVNGDYEPSNCRWESAVGQANNKRNNHLVTIGEEKRTLQQWCKYYGLEPSKVRYRLAQGWPIEQVFSPGDFRR